MYGALWRVIPGPVWVRVIVMILLAVAVLYGMVFWAFPWVQTLITPLDVTVEGT